MCENSGQEDAALYHFYQNMYGRDLRIWFSDEDGVPQFFSQKDGLIQGGPLSGTFSAITIMPLIEDIKSHMDKAYLPTRNTRRASDKYEKGHSCFHPFEPKGLVDDVTVRSLRRFSLKRSSLRIT